MNNDMIDAIMNTFSPDDFSDDGSDPKEETPKLKTKVKIGSFINVHHHKYGSVKMRVIDVHGNVVICEYDNIEEAVKMELFEDSWRWETITD